MATNEEIRPLAKPAFSLEEFEAGKVAPNPGWLKEIWGEWPGDESIEELLTATEKLWIYDFRTNKHFTLKENQLKRADLAEFVESYHAENRQERTVTERFHGFSYDELMQRDKVSLDIFWLRDDSLEDTDNLPAPAVIAAEIVEDLQAALEQFSEIASDLGGNAAEEQK